MSEDRRTIEDLAKNALAVQNACNLSGVVHSFGRDLTRLWAIAREEGWSDTDKINSHPICALYISKLESLCYCKFDYAYDWANEFSKVQK